jgi:hypothetical protein
LSSRGRLIRLLVFAAYGSVANSAIADVTLSFDCTPAISPSLSERDPVVRTAIAIDSNLWRVTHITANGVKVERTDQYRMNDISDQGSLAWQGVLILRPYLKMIGRLSGDRSEYIETLYDARKGGAQIAEFKSLCSSSASEQRHQSEAAVTSPPALAPRPGSGCSAVTDSNQRLACYDSAFGSPPSSPTPPVVAALPPTVVAAPAPSPATPPSPADVNSIPLSESDIPAMNDDFSKNEIRFGRNYVGRPFRGTLPLYSISEDLFTKGAYKVSFGDHTSGVDCVVSDKSNLDYITKLNSGDSVTVSGRVDSHAMGFDVKLSQCEFARP